MKYIIKLTRRTYYNQTPYIVYVYDINSKVNIVTENIDRAYKFNKYELDQYRKNNILIGEQEIIEVEEYSELNEFVKWLRMQRISDEVFNLIRLYELWKANMEVE